MNIVPAKAQAIVRRLFLTPITEIDRDPSHNNSVSLSRMGVLYIVASILQISWPYLVVSNWEVAKLWISFPVLGWAFIFIWVVMIWCIPHLFFLGFRMIQMSRNPKVIIRQTEYQRRRQANLAIILILGIILDVILFPLLLGVEDKSAVVFLTGMMGGRVMQASYEAIVQYHDM